MNKMKTAKEKLIEYFKNDIKNLTAMKLEEQNRNIRITYQQCINTSENALLELMKDNERDDSHLIKPLSMEKDNE